MITDQIGQYKVLLQLNNHNKLCDILGFFLHKTQEILTILFFSPFFASSEKKCHLSTSMRWRALSNHLGMTNTVLLHCPISAEIRTVESQSDLRILLQL